MLDKNYRPETFERRLYEAWDESGAFRHGQNVDGDPFTIVIPPPNVTGDLHLGHALNATLQDILVRFERMRGRDVLWQPGMDHAGISTQMVVERELHLEQSSRQEIGREAFVKRVWDWKDSSAGQIGNQLRRMGASCDWSRERFTLDEGLSRAVQKVFVELYREGLIYKDKRLVNWDPHFQTAISDLEVEQIETTGKLWYFRYPVEGEPDTFLTIATTRPETMLGDTAVAVHPDDERFRHLVGRNVMLPIADRLIPIIADEHADPEQGSGVVKITPAHDFNDFEVGRRHDLPMISIMDENACINENAPDRYQGLDRYEARRQIVKEMADLGLLVKEEEIQHSVPHGEKSEVETEPLLTDQWFLNAKVLAEPALKAVEDGETVFVPKSWEKTYFEWMRNIQPWCISRQLWWGHQIPAWYGPDDEIFVAYDEAEAHELAKAHYGKAVELERDEDVLDTWFSSALWPFSTLGWPDETPELERHYKTDVLSTAFDIIFFWVARMMMMGLHFMNEVPFHTVYIHALVRDEHGKKMSKTKGNGIDPLDLINEYGADALRFTLAAMAAQGRDISLSTSRIEGYRNFITKLWNASRFTAINQCFIDPAFDPDACTEPVNKWIVRSCRRAARDTTLGIEGYRFNDAADAMYRFTWGTFCDWYVEFIKPILMGNDDGAKQETRATAAWVLDQIVMLLHPFVPFVTEELWARLAEEAGVTRDRMVISESWPAMGLATEELEYETADEQEMNWVAALISEVRVTRVAANIPAGRKIQLLLVGASEENVERLQRHLDLILRLAHLESAKGASEAPKDAVQAVLGEATIALPLAGVIDFAEESARLKKEISKTDNEILKIEKKLGNQGFLQKAPEHVVDEQKDRRRRYQEARAILIEALDRLPTSA